MILSAVLAAVSLGVWMRWIEPGCFIVSRKDIRLSKRLPAPMRILHLSDLHFADPNPRLAHFFDRLARESYDVVFLTGDILDEARGIPFCMQQLTKLKPAAAYMAVFGNHDYYHYGFWDMFFHNFPGQKMPKNRQHVETLTRAMQGAGIRILKNETVVLNWKGTDVLIHGLDDPATGKANVRKVAASFEPDKINLLMTHTIDVFLDMKPGPVDMVFSGHSHGGQVCLPFLGPVFTHTFLGRAYAGGLVRYGTMWCSVSRGIGTSRFLPFRLLCRPEACLYCLEG